ncbi:diamine N-acetyltransferase [Entomortierella parvispora]|uniref:Diamine N-acetyltransferase n=1 Tax=Entomortierella parvispora TaxID=205924 RepID=A0A9P3H497_9FUNG|nr:diamine N-acetyltransferase [Entomortierella parvispora]
MSNMTLRRATTNDAAVLCELGALTFTKTFGHMYSSENLQHFLDDTYTIEKHLQPLNNPRESFWLLEDENHKALAFGQAGACKLPVKNLEPKAGEIKRIYCHPDQLGKGYGTQIFEKMLEWLDQVGYGPLYIGVWSENYGAHRFYQRHGFEHFSEYEFEIHEHRDREFIFKRA